MNTGRDLRGKDGRKKIRRNGRPAGKMKKNGKERSEN